MPLVRLSRHRKARLTDREEPQRVLLIGKRLLRSHLRRLLKRRSAACRNAKPGRTVILPGFYFW